MCRVPGHNHEWKDCYLSLMNKKIKDEENHNMSDDDSSECSSDESTHTMRNEDDAGAKPEGNDTNTYTIDIMPKVLILSNDANADSTGSDDDASTREGSMPNSLIKKKQAEDKSFNK